MVQRKCASPCGLQAIGLTSLTRQPEQLWVLLQGDHKGCIACEKHFYIWFAFSNSSLHLPQVKQHYKQKKGCDIWASTSKHLGHALLSDIFLEEHRCSWGQFLLMHLLTVLLLQDYKEFQMDLTMKISVILWSVWLTINTGLYLWFNDAGI